MSLFSRAILPSTRLASISRSTLHRPFTKGSLLLARPKKRTSDFKAEQKRVVAWRGERQQEEETARQEWERKANRYNKQINTSKYVIGGIIVTCIGTFAYHSILENRARQDPTQIPRFRSFEDSMVMSWRSIREGRLSTVFTSAFMHNNFMHLLFNMWALYGFGRGAYATLGGKQFTILYTGSIAAGAAVQYLWWTARGEFNSAAVGASGGVLGIIAAMAIMTPFSEMTLNFLIAMPLWVFAVGSVGASIAGLGGFWGKHIGHADHLGGMAFGAIFYTVMMSRPGMLKGKGRF